MKSIEILIEEMTGTRDLSRSKGNSSSSVIGQIAGTYADILTSYILRLQEINRLVDLQTAINPRPRERQLTPEGNAMPEIDIENNSISDQRYEDMVFEIEKAEAYRHDEF
jgi:hypothetical protein